MRLNYGLKAWKARQARVERREAKAKQQHRINISEAVKLLARIVPRLKRTTTDLEKRAICVRNALDILAGEMSVKEKS